MKVWIPMFISTLLIPILLVIFSIILLKANVKSNPLFGYRTTRSMKNELTWKYANSLCAKLMLFGSMVFMAINVVLMLLLLGKSEQVIETTALLLGFVPILVYLVVSIIIVEYKLKTNFDKDGNFIK